ncbi:MAG: hemolysin III family protein [Dehalococcoidia bacterium]|nr:hemolysin III family protein [Dehalococcoidia bacterium]
MAEGVALERPALRGLLHLAAAVAATLGAAWLLLRAGSPTGYVGGAIFGASLMLLYGTSATYHQVPWRTTWHRVVKRIDHAMIFVLIAGTYTPFCLDVSLAWGIPVLSVVWGVAGAGALLKIVWPDAPRWLGVGLYLSLGWVALVAASEVLAQYSAAPLALLLSGAVFYTTGGIVYGLRRPDPWPRVFGYHEVFHALVVAGSAVHYTAIVTYVL